MCKHNYSLCGCITNDTSMKSVFFLWYGVINVNVEVFAADLNTLTMMKVKED